MTKRFTLYKTKDNPFINDYENVINEWWVIDNTKNMYDMKHQIKEEEVVELLNSLSDEIERLKQDVEYWKQVASQYSNELSVFEHHCKRYKTECKDAHIGWKRCDVE